MNNGMLRFSASEEKIAIDVMMESETSTQKFVNAAALLAAVIVHQANRDINERARRDMADCLQRLHASLDGYEHHAEDRGMDKIRSFQGAFDIAAKLNELCSIMGIVTIDAGSAAGLISVLSYHGVKNFD